MQPGYWINTKPIYKTLAWESRATFHIVLAEGGAGRSVLRLFQQALPEHPVRVFYTPRDDLDLSPALRTVVGEAINVLKDEDALWDVFDVLLDCSMMGTRIYVAGSEAFLWKATAIAAKHGVLNADVIREQHESLARSVYCVHCKVKTHGVKTNIVNCSGCGRSLFVRDHFSRRLKAYMGLMVDAEDPGHIPEIMEVYP